MESLGENIGSGETPPLEENEEELFKSLEASFLSYEAEKAKLFKATESLLEEQSLFEDVFNRSVDIIKFPVEGYEDSDTFVEAFLNHQKGLVRDSEELKEAKIQLNTLTGENANLKLANSNLVELCVKVEGFVFKLEQFLCRIAVISGFEKLKTGFPLSNLRNFQTHLENELGKAAKWEDVQKLHMTKFDFRPQTRYQTYKTKKPIKCPSLFRKLTGNISHVAPGSDPQSPPSVSAEAEGVKETPGRNDENTGEKVGTQAGMDEIPLGNEKTPVPAMSQAEPPLPKKRMPAMKRSAAKSMPVTIAVPVIGQNVATNSPPPPSFDDQLPGIIPPTNRGRTESLKLIIAGRVLQKRKLQGQILLGKKHGHLGFVQGLYLCECGRTFNSLSTLKTHIDTLTKDLKFQCDQPECQNKDGFLKLGQLKQHLVKRHKIWNPLSEFKAGCTTCGDMLPTWKALFLHQKAVHPDVACRRRRVKRTPTSSQAGAPPAIAGPSGTHPASSPATCQNGQPPPPIAGPSTPVLPLMPDCTIDQVEGDFETGATVPPIQVETPSNKNRVGVSINTPRPGLKMTLRARKRNSDAGGIPGSESKFPCIFGSCDIRFNEVSALKTHLKQIHGVKDPFKEFSTGCQFCGAMFTDDRVATHHEKCREEQNGVCDSPQNIANQQNTLVAIITPDNSEPDTNLKFALKCFRPPSSTRPTQPKAGQSPSPCNEPRGATGVEATVPNSLAQDQEAIESESLLLPRSNAYPRRMEEITEQVSRQAGPPVPKKRTSDINKRSFNRTTPSIRPSPVPDNDKTIVIPCEELGRPGVQVAFLPIARAVISTPAKNTKTTTSRSSPSKGSPSPRSKVAKKSLGDPDPHPRETEAGDKPPAKRKIFNEAKSACTEPGCHLKLKLPGDLTHRHVKELHHKEPFVKTLISCESCGKILKDEAAKKAHQINGECKPPMDSGAGPVGRPSNADVIDREDYHLNLLRPDNLELTSPVDWPCVSPSLAFETVSRISSAFPLPSPDSKGADTDVSMVTEK